MSKTGKVLKKAKELKEQKMKDAASKNAPSEKVVYKITLEIETQKRLSSTTYKQDIAYMIESKKVEKVVTSIKRIRG